MSADLTTPADMQGISWEGPQEEPLYAVPKKEHQPRFTIEDFVLQKMLGKGSFGKVTVVTW